MSAFPCDSGMVATLQGAGFSNVQIQALCSTIYNNALNYTSMVNTTAYDALSAAATVQANLSDAQAGTDMGWLVITGAMVFIMHGGFAMVSANASGEHCKCSIHQLFCAAPNNVALRWCNSVQEHTEHPAPNCP
jgi:hypothetical protein